MMTDKEWAELITEAQNLRFQLAHNMVPPELNREVMQTRLKAVLEKLAKEGLV